MRIPKINSQVYLSTPEEIITQDIDIDLLERVYYEENIDPENPKEFPKVIKALKTLIRGSNEYKNMMAFLKKHHNMDQSLFFKGVKKTEDKKFSLEIHHTPFVLEDIVATVVRKRIANGESLKHLDIAYEVMQLHYAGLVGLVPLDKTTHALIHSENAPEVFIPLQFIEFGDFHQFFKDYKKYIPDGVKEAYFYLQDLSLRYERFQDVIPNYMKPKMLYYEGFLKLEEVAKVIDQLESEGVAN